MASSSVGGKAPPQLARECLSIGDSDSESSDGSESSGSLEILPPVQNSKNGTTTTASSSSSSLAPLNKTTTTAAAAAAAATKSLSQASKTVPKTAGTKKKTNAKQRARDGGGRDLLAWSSSASEDSDDDDDDDDDDDEDDLLLSSSQLPVSKSSSAPASASLSFSTKRKTQSNKTQLKKREREEQKEREKQDRARRRQNERDQRERKRVEEKILKSRQNQANSQATGKFKELEIAILLDKTLHKDDPYGLVQALGERFLIHCQDDATMSFSSNSAASIQFIRKDYLVGGAKAAVEALQKKKPDDFEHLPTLALTILPDDFISLLRRQDRDEDDDFPALEAWLKQVVSQWQNMWHSKTRPRLFLILPGISETLDQKWVEHRRRQKSGQPSLPTAWELQDAMQWLLVNYQVECIPCPTNSPGILQGSIEKMTRGLCDKPYNNMVTELECVKKLKQGDVTGDDPLQRASDVWLRQLQQVRGLSEKTAQNVVARYPTCQSLWQAYREVDGDEKSKSSLLANVLSDGVRQQQKLSTEVYRVMTSNDPNEVVL